MTQPLGRAELARPVLQLAPALLGTVLATRSVGEVVRIRLTEVEAYAGTADPASHAFRGRTPRTAVMFGPPGHLYVYFSYGMHWCANVVCDRDGQASAVLLRAGEVLEGLEAARARRPGCRRDVDLARGPARLARAAGLDGGDDGLDLCAPETRVWLEHAPGSLGPISTGPRVGVNGEGGRADRYPWRFWLAGEPTVSPYRAGVPRRGRAGAPPPDPAAASPAGRAGAQPRGDDGIPFRGGTRRGETLPDATSEDPAEGLG